MRKWILRHQEILSILCDSHRYIIIPWQCGQDISSWSGQCSYYSLSQLSIWLYRTKAMVNFTLTYSNGDAGYTLSQWKWMSILFSHTRMETQDTLYPNVNGCLQQIREHIFAEWVNCTKSALTNLFFFLCWSNQQDAQKVAISCATECNAVFDLDRCTWFRWSTGAQDKWCAYELDYLRLKLSRGRVLTNRNKNMIWLKSHVFVSCSMEMLDWNSLFEQRVFLKLTLQYGCIRIGYSVFGRGLSKYGTPQWMHERHERYYLENEEMGV